MNTKTRGTTSEAELRALAAQGLSFPEMAKLLNLNVDNLRTTASMLGISSGRPHKASHPVEQWVARIEAGESAASIAREIGKSTRCVSVTLVRRVGRGPEQIRDDARLAVLAERKKLRK